MGVNSLKTFINKKVPRGTFPINIRNEIRKYYSSSTSPNPPAPVIVVDLMCLVYPFCSFDRRGVILGGRFNEIYRRMNQFFAELTSLGVKLEFFLDGPKRRIVPEKWCKRKDASYRELLKLFDAVDAGADVASLIKSSRLPFLYAGTLKRATMNHGQLHFAVDKECDQEMVAFANKCKAMAIVSDDTDFLVYEGSWRLWDTAQLNLMQLTTVEYNRVRLARFLGLEPPQMPLLATLVGNDIVHPSVLKKFHCHLGNYDDRLTNVAKFICNHQSVDEILTRVLEFYPDEAELKSDIQESLDMYQENIHVVLETSDDPIEAELLSRNLPVIYQVLKSSYMKCKLGVTDLRQSELGAQIPQLKLFLMLRMSGIVLHQQKKEGTSAKCNVMIKLRHDSNYALHNYNAVFPSHIEPMSLEELLSNEPCNDLQDTKLQLFCWIASHSIDHHRMKSVPKSLHITVVTLYHLLELQLLRLFEADLILQVIHDVTFSKYDPRSVVYPRKLDSRPFRVAFVFQDVYVLLAKAFAMLGLTASSDYDPPFDGALFHSRYREWSSRKAGDDAHLQDILEWRIYKSIPSDLSGEALG